MISPAMKILPAILFALLPLAAIAAPKPPEPPPLEKPKPPPAQVSSSEGMPPLPYPVVPQKRQERKNPPQPPVLLTKIRTADAEDWARTPHDLKKLLEWMSGEMGASFSSNIKTWMITFGSSTSYLTSNFKSFALNLRCIRK